MSGRGEGSSGPPASALLPEAVRKVLPADTARTWQTLAPHLPEGLYLGGGSAIAVHLAHRKSRDLDFFFHDNSVDLVQLETTLQDLGLFAGGLVDEGTLRGLFSQTKIEAFNASELKRLRKPTVVAGLRVAALEDLLAMKIKVMAERGEMRDYFDVMTIDEKSSLSVEEGIELYLERYKIKDPEPGRLRALYLAMGFPDDVETDEALPIALKDLAAWWRKRQAAVVRNSSWFS
ncbi:MAG: nucleotidyl transferase AbiEii/AbiGii toxin family protein [Solirubrobacterales bacterium]